MLTLQPLPTLPVRNRSGSDGLVERLQAAIERIRGAHDAAEARALAMMVRETGELLYSVAEMEGIVDQHEADAAAIEEKMGKAGPDLPVHRMKHLRGRLLQHRALAARRRVTAITMLEQVRANLALIESGENLVTISQETE